MASQNKKRVVSYRISKICLFCDREFVAKSNIAKYCSVACRDKARYIRDRDKRISAVQEYRDRNRVEIRKRAKSARLLNPNKYRLQNKKSYQRHRKARIDNSLRYQKENPHVAAATRLNRAAGKRHMVSSRDLKRVIYRQRNRCFYCNIVMTKAGNKFPTSLQWDHVIPRSRGGSHSIGNIVASCRKCNHDKAAMLVMEWRIFKLYRDSLDNLPD